MKKLLSIFIFLTLTMTTQQIKSKNIVVIGASASGTAVVKELLHNKFSGTITWIAAETDQPYKKTQIDSFLEGTKSQEAITIFDTSSLPANVKLLLGKK